MVKASVRTHLLCKSACLGIVQHRLVSNTLAPAWLPPSQTASSCSPTCSCVDVRNGVIAYDSVYSGLSMETAQGAQQLLKDSTILPSKHHFRCGDFGR
jgi:hypothetical protein